MTGRTDCQCFTVSGSHGFFPCRISGQVFEALYLMNFNVVTDCAAQFTGSGSEFTQQPIGLCVSFVSLQQVYLSEKRFRFAFKALIVVHAFFPPGFCFVGYSKVAIFNITDFDFTSLGAVFCRKVFSMLCFMRLEKCANAVGLQASA